MALTVAELVGIIDLDDSKFDSGLRRAEAKFRAFAGKADTDGVIGVDDSKVDSGLGRAEGKFKALDGREIEGVVSVDDSKVDSGLNRIEGKLKSFAGNKAAVLGAAMGTALVAGLSETLNVEAANDKLSAQLALTEAESKRIGQAAGDLYAGAWGDSLEDVNIALRGVINNVKGMRNASEAELEAVGAKVIDVGTAFDQDLGQVTRAVGKMIKTGLVKDADEALDVLTRGFQTGADEAEDLLETVNEYSTMFREIGLSGDKALGLISQGLKAGARDADTVADAIKEFAIRGKDGSDATAEGFKAIGLNAETMAKKIAAGGPTAAKALDETLDRLRAMEDPVARDAAAVALFGTKAEDLGDALFALDPGKAVDALGKVKGAAKGMGDTLNDNANTNLTSFWRQAKRTFVDLVGGTILPIINDGAQALSAMFGPAVRAVADFFRDHLIPLWERIEPVAGPAAVAVLGVATAVFAMNKALRLVRGAGAFLLRPLTQAGLLGGSAAAGITATGAAAGNAAKGGLSKLVGKLGLIGLGFMAVDEVTGGLPSKMMSAGGAAVRGLVAGITGNQEALDNAVNDMSNTFADIADSLGIIDKKAILSNLKKEMEARSRQATETWKAIRHRVSLINAEFAKLGMVPVKYSALKTGIDGMNNVIDTGFSNTVRTSHLGMLGLTNNVKKGGKNAVTAAQPFVGGYISKVTGAMNGGTTAVNRGMGGLKKGVSKGVSSAVSAAAALPGRIRAAISMDLFGSGTSAMNSFAAGIRSAAAGAKAAAAAAMRAVRGLFGSSPAKEGPFSGRGWTLYSGLALIDDFAKGISKAAPGATRAINSAMSKIAGSPGLDARGLDGRAMFAGARARGGDGASASAGGAGVSLVVTTAPGADSAFARFLHGEVRKGNIKLQVAGQPVRVG